MEQRAIPDLREPIPALFVKYSLSFVVCVSFVPSLVFAEEAKSIHRKNHLNRPFVYLEQESHFERIKRERWTEATLGSLHDSRDFGSDANEPP